MSKKTTKQKIVAEAIRMYNKSGVQNVTSRHIAAELGISHGNLDYHYPTKEDLLLAIYKKMRSEMSEWYELKLDGQNSFEVFRQLMDHLDEFQVKYRFFNLDVLEISRSFPEVAALIQETLEMRKTQMSEFFNAFMEEGLITDNPVDHYITLKHTIRILITFWMSQQEVLPSYRSSRFEEMSKYVWRLIYPYMTPEGKKVYRQITKDVRLN